MDNETKRKLILMGLTCLKKEGEDLPTVFEEMEKEIPTEDEIEKINKGVKTGEIEDDLLKKFWPIAYNGVSKHGLIKYFFYNHNLFLDSLPKDKINPKLIKWCIAYPAKIVGRIASKYVIEIIDGEKTTTDLVSYPGLDVSKDEFNIGTYVAYHRDRIHMVLEGKQHEEAVKFYKEFQNHLKPKD